jgi:putative transposase
LNNVEKAYMNNLAKENNNNFTIHFKKKKEPKFETQRMVFRSRRKISSKTARKMLTWSHYRFKTRLMNKAREYPNCRVIICGEKYTSQTCSECGYFHRKIGGAKKFKCPGCHQESDRDFNAVRNILLKNMILGFRD